MNVSSFERRLADAMSIEITDASLDKLDRLLAGKLSRRRMPRLDRWRIAVVVAILAISTSVAAVATAGIKHTEDPFGDVDAAGFQAEIDAAKQVVPLPAGVVWPSYLKAQDENAGYSRNGGRFWVEEVAFCLWIDSWATAVDTADTASAEVARDTLLSVPTWTLYSSPFADQSYRDVLDRSLAGVQGGDVRAARDASQPACP